MTAVPTDAGTQRLAPVTEASLGGGRRREQVLPERSRADGARSDSERPSRAGLWVLLALLAAAILALGVLVLQPLLGNGAKPLADVQVANVVGKPIADATAQLKAQGLKVTSTDATDPDVAEGSVISQLPPNPTKVAPGTEVALTVSTGPGTVTVPVLKGESRADAEQMLTDVGLTLGEVTEVDSTEKAGRVISSDPPAQSPIAPKSPVALTVSTGKVKVPNVISFSLERAALLLTEAGLIVDASTFVDSPQPDNTVIDQTFSGKTVPVGTKIRLIISAPTPTPPPTVPTVPPVDPAVPVEPPPT